MRFWALCALASLLAVLASACGGSSKSTSSSSAATPPAAGSTTAAAPTSTESTGGSTSTAGKSIKVGLVTDIGGLNDKSFNFLANKGLEQAKTDLGIQGDVKESHSDADYVPNLTFYAQQKYDLVIGVGFLMGKAMGQVAKQFPDVHFAIIDFSATDKAIGGSKNVTGLLFKEQEAGYLVGYMAGDLAKMKFAKMTETISSVGGVKIPPVDHYIAGYQAGAKAADPAIKTLNGYSNDFVKQDACKGLADSQIASGSSVVFQVAGGCGLGALDAAKEKNVWGIGVDADQSAVGPQMLASAVKKVDNAVLQTIKAVQDGSIKGGADTPFGLKEDGVGIAGINSTVPQSVQDDVQKQADAIKAGSVTPPDTVK